MIRVTVAPAEPERVAAARRRIRPALTAAVTVIINTAHGRVADETPDGHSGLLRGGYTTNVRGAGGPNPTAVLENPLRYHDAVEDGRRPGRPPPSSALVPWVGSKLGVPPGPERERVAYVVARAIGRRGTTGAHMVRTGWERTRRDVAPVVRRMGVRIVGDTR